MVEDFFLQQKSISEEKVCYQLELRNKFADILTECSNRYPVESEEVRKMLPFIAMHCIIGGQRLVRIASLPWSSPVVSWLVYVGYSLLSKMT